MREWPALCWVDVTQAAKRHSGSCCLIGDCLSQQDQKAAVQWCQQKASRQGAQLPDTASVPSQSPAGVAELPVTACWATLRRALVVSKHDCVQVEKPEGKSDVSKALGHISGHTQDYRNA
jgi:hypothetical protein